MLGWAADALAAENATPAGPVFRDDGPKMSRYTSVFSGFPKAGRDNWSRPQFSVDGFSRLDEILDAHVAAAPAEPTSWQRPAVEPSIAYDGAPRFRPGRHTLDDYLSRNATTGLIIAQGDTILVGRYQYGRHDRHRLTSFSMAKTVIAMLIGVAVDDGHIESIDDSADRYVPGLEGSEYGKTPYVIS